MQETSYVATRATALWPNELTIGDDFYVRALCPFGLHHQHGRLCRMGSGRPETRAQGRADGRGVERTSHEPVKAASRAPFLTDPVAPVIASHAPALVAAAGARASYRFLEFFTAQIRNPHTRRAYARAAAEFFDWLEAKGVTQLTTIESVHVATYALAAALLGDAIEGRTPGDELAEEGPAS